MSSLLADPETSGASVPSYADTQRPLWQRLLFTRDAAVIALLVAVTAYSISAVPFFSNDITLYFLLLDLTPILLIALPMTMVIITGEIDLSVASTVALSSVLFGVLHREGLPIVAAALLALVGAALCGAFNGFLVTKVGLPSLAVTIGTLALYRGIAVGLLGTTAITNWPKPWTDLAKNKLGDSMVPVVVIPIVVLAVIFAILLHFTSFGRGVYAIGLSREAARFSGVNVDRTKLVLFTLSGLVSGMAGIYFTLRFGSARGDNANGMELQVIAAVLLGGVSIFGGRGAIPGVLGGVLLIGVIASALRLDDYSANVIQIITGILLIASVVAPSLLGWIGRTRSRAATRPPKPDQNLSEATTTPTSVPNGSSK
jgi:rhamnose transport system permease protein